jgi:hypothetical protein
VPAVEARSGRVRDDETVAAEPGCRVNRAIDLTRSDAGWISLEVEVWTEAASAHADGSDPLTSGDSLPGPHIGPSHMGIEGARAIGMPNCHVTSGPASIGSSTRVRDNSS